MLREGLRAELPGLASLPARLRLPALPQTSPWLTAISALGVSLLVSAFFGTVFSAGFYFFGPLTPQLRNAAGTTSIGYALAIAFAFGAARWQGMLAAAGPPKRARERRRCVGRAGRRVRCGG